MALDRVEWPRERKKKFIRLTLNNSDMKLREYYIDV
jgi:hypothetical protein